MITDIFTAQTPLFVDPKSKAQSEWKTESATSISIRNQKIEDENKSDESLVGVSDEKENLTPLVSQDKEINKDISSVSSSTQFPVNTDRFATKTSSRKYRIKHMREVLEAIFDPLKKLEGVLGGTESAVYIGKILGLLREAREGIEPSDKDEQLTISLLEMALRIDLPDLDKEAVEAIKNIVGHLISKEYSDHYLFTQDLLSKAKLNVLPEVEFSLEVEDAK